MPLIIGFLLLLVGIYYITIVANFFGIEFYPKKEIHFGKALIPFFYWFKKRVKKKKITPQSKSKK